MKVAKLLAILFIICFIANCTKDESLVSKPVAEEQSTPKDSITDDPDTEVPSDSIPETAADSIPEIPVDSIPEIPIDSIPVVYFSFQGIGNSQATADMDDAIMIHSAEGDLLDFKTFEGGDLLFFESISQIKPDNFTVSILHRITYSGPKEQYSITTFPNVENGSFWTNYKKPDELPHRPQGNLIGGFNVAITDLPEELLRFRLTSYDETRSLGVYNFENGSYTLHLDNLGVYERNDFILSVVEKNNEKKYLKIENVQPNDDLAFSYNDLLEYDNTIEIEVPENFINQFYSQLGSDEEIGSYAGGVYALDHFEIGKSSSNPPNLITLGFIDNLPSYETVVQLLTDDYKYSYYKFGAATDNIILKGPSYSVQNESLFDFEFTTDTNYFIRTSEWRTVFNPNLETVWSVLSPFDQNPKINELPENLSVTFPNIEVENLIHSRSSFRTRSISYSEFIRGSFDVNAAPLSPIYELESYTVRDN